MINRPSCDPLKNLENGDEFLNEEGIALCTCVRFMIGMNVNNCATSDGTTGAGTGGGTGPRSRGREGGHSSNATLNSDGGRRQYNDQQQNNHFREQQPQKRQRSGQEQQQQQAMASVTSTMQSTATIIPPDNDHSNLKAKGHYSSSSSMELYFAWFSAITFIGELFIGKHWSYHDMCIDMLEEDQRGTPINLFVFYCLLWGMTAKATTATIN